MAIAAPQKFYTYKPGVGGSKLSLAPGQTLGFQAGKGYYAKPAPVATAKPKPPPVTTAPQSPYTAPASYAPPQPNYGADLAGAPDFTQAEGDYQYGLDMAHQNRRDRIRSALVRLGFQPGSADARALEGIDPSTAELATQNSDSVLAQLGLQRGQQRSDLQAELASRGLLDSGALRGGENMVQSNYDKGVLNATQGYLDEQNAALSDEANGIASGQSTFTAAKAAAALAAAQNPLFTPVYGASTDTAPVLDPSQGSRPAQTPVLAQPPKPAAVAPPARYYTYKNQVPLKAGQTLKFTAGRGYYAG